MQASADGGGRRKGKELHERKGAREISMVRTWAARACASTRVDRRVAKETAANQACLSGVG